MKFNLSIREFDLQCEDDLARLRFFCERCAELNIVNNSSFAKIKLDDFRNPSAKLWVVIDLDKNQEIIGMAGAHQLSEMGEDYYRLLFRGCILPAYRGMGAEGLSKKHLNSYIFNYLTPLQIRWAQALGGKNFVVSTNVDYHQTQTSPTDRVFKLLEKQGIVRLLHENYLLFGVIQNIWAIKPDFFFS